MRILITDSDSRSALAATRSLGRRGHTVITAGESAASLAAVSRYSAGFVQYPSPARQPDQFVASIVRETNAQRVDVLLPTTEITTLLLTNHRQQLAPTCRLPFADTETIAHASDKSRMVELAQRLGVPTPATARITHVDELDRVELPPYPVVIKPSRSRVRTESGWVGTSVTYAANRAELESP